VRSLNLSRRHLTLAQKREVAKHIFEREPGRTPNSVAEEVGISPPTAQKVQHEVEAANSKNSNNGNGAFGSHAGDGPAEPVTGAPGEEMPPAPAPVRVEVTGRKARGRKPLSPEEKARRADERRRARVESARGRARDDAIRVQAAKTTQLKPLTSVREDEIDTIAQQVGGNLKLLPEIVNIISGYDGLIQRHFTLGQRHEMARQFAKALGVSSIE